MVKNMDSGVAMVTYSKYAMVTPATRRVSYFVLDVPEHLMLV